MVRHHAVRENPTGSKVLIHPHKNPKLLTFYVTKSKSPLHNPRHTVINHRLHPRILPWSQPPRPSHAHHCIGFNQDCKRIFYKGSVPFYGPFLCEGSVPFYVSLFMQCYKGSVPFYDDETNNAKNLVTPASRALKHLVLRSKVSCKVTDFKTFTADRKGLKIPSP